MVEESRDVGAGIRDRALAFARGEYTAAGVPRPASTVILLRDAADGLETFIMRRVRSMAFAPGMHVFPGGRVDASDTDGIQLTIDAAEQARLAARASTDAAGLVALYSCAVRETLEETGVGLVADGWAGEPPAVDPAALPIVAHWVTPEVEDHRYDVRFFAAVVSDQEAQLATTEGDHAAWIAPAEALRLFTEGSMAMLPPTVAMLRLLLGFADARSALLAAADRPVVPVLPRPFLDNAGEVRWSLVNDRTGEVVVADVAAPHPRETQGIFDVAVEAEPQ